MINDIERERELQELEKQMTPKQITFCNKYIELGNGAQAAIQAGYSERSAKEIASENLTKHNIKRYIDIRQQQIQDETIADAIEIQQRITAIFRGEEKEEVLIGLGNGRQKIVEKEANISDKLRALELLGRRYALFTDRMEVDGEVGAVIIDDIPSDIE